MLSDKFLAHGYAMGASGGQGKYRGSGIATAYMSGVTACIAEALTGRGAADVIKSLKRQALVPVPEIGYS